MKQMTGDDWFNNLDNRVCDRKRNTPYWLRKAHEEQPSSRHSFRSNKNHSIIQSNRSSELRGFKCFKSSKGKEVDDRLKIAELLAEAQYIEQRH